MAAVELVQCYNKGCGLKFNPLENKEDSCQYHPGGPIFHDALKGWSCCKKRSTDFSEFLAIPGCTRGLHSNEKPAEPVKPTQTIDTNGVDAPVVTEGVIKPPQPMTRPAMNEPMVKLSVNVANSLKQALEKQMSELSIAATASNTADNTTVLGVRGGNFHNEFQSASQFVEKPPHAGVWEGSEGVIAKGTSCKNNACTVTYESEATDRETCFYHPGVPVFHEGMKYWSCCERKTTEFDSFLSQAGCTSGQHLWKKKEEPGEKKVACRMDWHQTGSFVTVSIFAKLSQPHKTVIEANKVTLRVNVVFDGGKSQFEKYFVLHGIIDPEKSNVKMLGTKVEINLKKMEPGSWAKLELQPANQA